MTTEKYIITQLEKFLSEKNIDALEVRLQKPKEEKFGDFATSLALQLARFLKKKPAAIAEDIKNYIQLDKRYISKIEIAGPGFLNFFSAHEDLYSQLKNILNLEAEYGKSNLAQGKKAQVEFVSANPTGPLTIGHGRGAVLGDAIARLLEAVGYDVTREYYFNNAGRQMRVLGESVRMRYLELIGEKVDFPESHYQGEYIIDILLITSYL